MSQPPAPFRHPFLGRGLIAALLVATSLFALAAPAFAVEPGRNGQIVFTSGREGADDSAARLYLRGAFGNSGFGELSAPITPVGGQSRHPSWSPDRTKIVYANGSLANDEYDLFVKDMVTGNISALDLAEVADGKSSDHPTWSPDGTRIAYEHETTANNPNREIMVKTVGTAAPATALTNSPEQELKPAWSRDSQTLYYAKRMPGPPINYDIVRRAADGSGAETPVVNEGDVDEYQPAISPDGTQMCFTRQDPAGDTTKAEIWRVNLPGANNETNISDDGSRGDINCVFSPDGKKIAYTKGTFGAGRLVMESSNDSDTIPTELADDQGSNNFDGNADWAPDASPECPDTSVTTRVNTPVTINLECTDTGPLYERSDPNGFVANDGKPQNGETSNPQPTANPSTVVYTPKAGFSGTDKLEYTSFDKAGFGTDRGTVTITVQRAPGNGGGGNGGGNGGGGNETPAPKCAGRSATIVGTPGNDSLTGTRGPDVIVAGAGNDVVRSAGGNDIVCAGSGNDRVSAGSGNDRVSGQSGNDRISGGAGKDRLNGGKGRDVVNGNSGRDTIAGSSGRDRLNGGSGNDRITGGSSGDRLSGGAGGDRLSGGSARDTCSGGSGRNRVRCEVVR